MATLKLTALSRGGLCLLNLSKTVNNSSIGITGILSNGKKFNIFESFKIGIEVAFIDLTEQNVSTTLKSFLQKVKLVIFLGNDFK
jgi:hypothetical protein